VGVPAIKANQSIKLKVRSKTGNKAQYRLKFHRNVVIATCACGAQFLVVKGKDSLNAALRVHIAEHRCGEKQLQSQAPTVSY
jgi:hypothetical protein